MENTTLKPRELLFFLMLLVFYLAQHILFSYYYNTISVDLIEFSIATLARRI